MAVLSNIDLRKVIENDEGIIILNRREKNLTAVGYDLTIGFICDSETGEEPSLCKCEGENRYKLVSRHRYLIASAEYIFLSEEYMATIHSRGSYAIKGIIVTSTTIDANYRGRVWASVYNCSDHSVYIKKTNQFATMVIHALCTPTDMRVKKDALDTLQSKFCNVHEGARTLAHRYNSEEEQKIKYEFDEAKDKIKEKSRNKRMKLNMRENWQKS